MPKAPRVGIGFVAGPQAPKGSTKPNPPYAAREPKGSFAEALGGRRVQSFLDRTSTLDFAGTHPGGDYTSACWSTGNRTEEPPLIVPSQRERSYNMVI